MTTKTNRLAVPEALMAQVPTPAEKQSASSTAKSSKSQAGTKSVAAPKHPQVDQAEWCLVVVPDGEYPTLEILPNIDALTKRMLALEGQDVSVFPIFGVPAPFTAGPNRFLELPDGQPHPVFEFSGYGTLVPNPSATVRIDPTYFLGPNRLRDGFPKTAVVDHRPTVAEAGAGNGQQCRETMGGRHASRDRAPATVAAGD
jgi:hypothetical protein